LIKNNQNLSKITRNGKGSEAEDGSKWTVAIKWRPMLVLTKYLVIGSVASSMRTTLPRAKITI